MTSKLPVLTAALAILVFVEPDRAIADADCFHGPVVEQVTVDMVKIRSTNNCGGTATVHYTRVAPNGKVEKDTITVLACSTSVVDWHNGQYSFSVDISGGANKHCQHTHVERDDKGAAPKTSNQPNSAKTQATHPPSSAAPSQSSALDRALEQAKKKSAGSGEANRRETQSLERNAEDTNRAREQERAAERAAAEARDRERRAERERRVQCRSVNASATRRNRLCCSSHQGCQENCVQSWGASSAHSCGNYCSTPDPTGGYCFHPKEFRG